MPIWCEVSVITPICRTGGGRRPSACEKFISPVSTQSFATPWLNLALVHTSFYQDIHQSESGGVHHVPRLFLHPLFVLSMVWGLLGLDTICLGICPLAALFHARVDYPTAQAISYSSDLHYLGLLEICQQTHKSLRKKRKRVSDNPGDPTTFHIYPEDDICCADYPRESVHPPSLSESHGCCLEAGSPGIAELA